VKILVVDDEALARERLLRILRSLQPGAQCTEAASGQEALQLVESVGSDLVLLDIRMPGMDGIEVATHLDTLENPPAIVFCTAFDEYALQALQHQAVAYLLKPVREVELARALGAAGRVNRLQLASLRQGQLDSPRSHVCSQTHRGLETMPVEDVRCFMAEQKYVVARSAERELLLQESLKELEGEFGDRFIRIHRNALVSRPHILGLQKEGDGSWSVELEGLAERAAVSRRHLAAVKQLLLNR
jgi:two-component system response regulator AlgR